MSRQSSSIDRRVPPAQVWVRLGSDCRTRAIRARQVDQHWQLRIERARDEADLARRRFFAVGPEHGLVARSLERVIFRAILVHVLSPIVGQAFSPKVVHPFSPILVHSLSPKPGQDGAGETPPYRAYSQLFSQREWEESCLERGKKPWTFERF
jgi:hypothetical protein